MPEIFNAMDKNEIIPNKVQYSFEEKIFLARIEKRIALKISGYLKKSIYIIVLGGLILFFNGCIIGKSTTEPTFIPKDNEVRQRNKHRVFVAGHWEKGSKGRRWVRGHWERK